MTRLEKTIETAVGQVRAIIQPKTIVFIGENITVNRVDYFGRGQISLRDGQWKFGSYTELSLNRKDKKDAYSHNAMEKWGNILVQSATELATPQNLKEAEWHQSRQDLLRNIAEQDDHRSELAKLREKEGQLRGKLKQLTSELKGVLENKIDQLETELEESRRES